MSLTVFMGKRKYCSPKFLDEVAASLTNLAPKVAGPTIPRP